MAVTVSMVAAIGRNRELGKDNDLLWHIPEDLAYFKSVTMGCPVIMGRRTYDSLPAVVRPLPGRVNVVLQQPDESALGDGVVVTHDLDAAVDAAVQAAAEAGRGEVFVIGGGSVYAQLLARADRLYVTEVDVAFDGADVFFPDFADAFYETSRRVSSDDNFDYSFVVYERKQ